MQHFASDNYAGICPEALSALLAANDGHVRSYGDDEWTLRVADRLRELFETDCDVYFVFNGTAANSLALAALCQPYHSVICHQLAHVDTDECGAPEFFSNGAKLLAVAGEQGKLTPAAIVEVVTRRSDIHYPKPKVVTLTQATEVGTVYRPTNCGDRRYGARTWPARAHGRRPLCQCRRRSRPEPGGSDLAGRRRCAVLWRHQDGLAGRRGGRLLRPQAGRRFRLSLQTGRPTGVEDALPVGAVARNSRKRRLVAARRARQRHGTASGGRSGRRHRPAGAFPVQANGVFVRLPGYIEAGLRARGWLFYNFIAAGGARFMCGWDTAPETVDRLLADIRELAAAARREHLAFLSALRRRAWRCEAVGGLPRLHCGADCGFVHWDNPAPVLAALVEYRGRHRAGAQPRLGGRRFRLITGFLERDEAPAAGVAREVKGRTRPRCHVGGDADRRLSVRPQARSDHCLPCPRCRRRGEIRL
jgi:threonine aldolase